MGIRFMGIPKKKNWFSSSVALNNLRRISFFANSQKPDIKYFNISFGNLFSYIIFDKIDFEYIFNNL
jgi:hypothetical protein